MKKFKKLFLILTVVGFIFIFNPNFLSAQQDNVQIESLNISKGSELKELHLKDNNIDNKSLKVNYEEFDLEISASTLDGIELSKVVLKFIDSSKPLNNVIFSNEAKFIGNIAKVSVNFKNVDPTVKLKGYFVLDIYDINNVITTKETKNIFIESNEKHIENSSIVISLDKTEHTLTNYKKEYNYVHPDASVDKVLQYKNGDKVNLYGVDKASGKNGLGFEININEHLTGIKKAGIFVVKDGALEEIYNFDLKNCNDKNVAVDEMNTKCKIVKQNDENEIENLNIKVNGFTKISGTDLLLLAILEDNAGNISYDYVPFALIDKKPEIVDVKIDFDGDSKKLKLNDRKPEQSDSLTHYNNGDFILKITSQGDALNNIVLKIYDYDGKEIEKIERKFTSSDSKEMIFDSKKDFKTFKNDFYGYFVLEVSDDLKQKTGEKSTEKLLVEKKNDNYSNYAKIILDKTKFNFIDGDKKKDLYKDKFGFTANFDVKKLKKAIKEIELFLYSEKDGSKVTIYKNNFSLNESKNNSACQYQEGNNVRCKIKDRIKFLSLDLLTEVEVRIDDVSKIDEFKKVESSNDLKLYANLKTVGGNKFNDFFIPLSLDKEEPTVNSISYKVFENEKEVKNVNLEIDDKDENFVYFFNDHKFSLFINASDKNVFVEKASVQFLNDDGTSAIKEKKGSQCIYDNDRNGYNCRIDVDLQKDLIKIKGKDHVFKGRLIFKVYDKVDHVKEVKTKKIIIEPKNEHVDFSNIQILLDKTPFKQGSHKEDYNVDLKDSFLNKISGYKNGDDIKLYADDSFGFETNISDNASGIKDVDIFVLDGDDKKEIYNFKQEECIKDYNTEKIKCEIVSKEKNIINSLKVKLNKIDQFEKNDLILLVLLTDNAENKSYNFIPFGVDKTNPSANLSFTNDEYKEGNIYNHDINILATVTDQTIFNPKNQVSLTIKKDGSLYNVNDEWNLKDTNPKNVFEKNIILNEDGDYEVHILATDGVNKKAENTIKFSIDKTPPIINISYDNNNAKNKLYFNKNRVLNVEIIDRNFAPEKAIIGINAKLKDKNISTPKYSWNKKDDTHYYASVVFEQDAEYEISFSATDKVGNKTKDVHKADGVALYNFVIDKTIDDIEIKNVYQNGSFNDSAYLEFKFNDLNFEGYDFELSYQRYDKVYNLTDDFKKNVVLKEDGIYLPTYIFQKVKDRDGIYHLYLKTYDKAGNEAVKDFNFIINRFGSVFVYDEYLTSILSGYFQKIDKNILIREFNPSLLRENKTKIVITRDSNLISDLVISKKERSFKVKGNSFWNEYLYDIPKENFEKDGLYVITISTQDEMENVSTNNKEGKISFTVDSTKPSIENISGLDKTIINAKEVVVSFDAFDSVGLKNIQIYINDKLVKEFNDLKNATKYKGQFVMKEGVSQKVNIKVVDLAGNEYNSNDDRNLDIYNINDEITISTNFFTRLYYNKTVFYTCLGVLFTFLVLLFLLIFKRRKRKD